MADEDAEDGHDGARRRRLLAALTGTTAAALIGTNRTAASLHPLLTPGSGHAMPLPDLRRALETVRAGQCWLTPTREQAEEFWRRALIWTGANGKRLEVRELDRLGEYLHLVRAGKRAEWNARRHDPFPTISVTGDVVLLSPELADTSDPAHDDFRAENVLNEPLTEIIDHAHQLGYVRDFLTGLDRCRAECAFFDFCRGAQAVNRYFQNGSLRSTETNCRRTVRRAEVRTGYCAELFWVVGVIRSRWPRR